MDYLERDDILDWLEDHGVERDCVLRVEFDIGTVKNGCMRVVVCATDPVSGARMAGDDELLTEERIIRLQALPGQETIEFTRSV